MPDVCLGPGHHVGRQLLRPPTCLLLEAFTQERDARSTSRWPHTHPQAPGRHPLPWLWCRLLPQGTVPNTHTLRATSGHLWPTCRSLTYTHVLVSGPAAVHTCSMQAGYLSAHSALPLPLPETTWAYMCVSMESQGGDSHCCPHMASLCTSVDSEHI